MKANHKQNAVKLTAANLTVRANRKQTEEITYVTVLTALVQYTSVHEIESVLIMWGDH